MTTKKKTAPKKKAVTAKSPVKVPPQLVAVGNMPDDKDDVFSVFYHVTVGLEGRWEPSIEELENVAKMVSRATYLPVLVTPVGVTINKIGQQ